MTTEPQVEFGTFDFGLDPDEELRAQELHSSSLIIDMLFQGPCSYRSFNEEQRECIDTLFENAANIGPAFGDGWRQMDRWVLRGEWDEFRDVWLASGITGGNRQFSFHNPVAILQALGSYIAQFDRCDWIVKGLCGDDFRRAKREGKALGYLSCQDTTGIGQDLTLIDAVFDLGVRMIGLTYNHANSVATGCTDRGGGGVTTFGERLIDRLDELGVIVDTAHSNDRTTIEACEISRNPVVASHTSAKSVTSHDRAKCDEAITAVAKSGGVVGVAVLPAFVSTEREATIEATLDHIDYISELVGWQHVGIGTDWPMMFPKRALRRVSELEGQLGFRPEHRIDWETNLVGFDDYRDFRNITRGLVKRGYDDTQIAGILGSNFLRVFDEVCGSQIVGVPAKGR